MNIGMALLNWISGSVLIPSRMRLLILRAAGMRVPLRGRIAHDVVFRTTNLEMGRGSTINWRCSFDNRARVTIGKRVGIGVAVNFITSDHDTADPDARAGRGTLAPITVGDGCYIGTGATILNGVTIGPGTVIAAGALVRDDCEPHSVYGGVPARKLRDLATA